MSGGLIVTAGILLLIPRFIADTVALCLLMSPLRHVMRVWRSAVARNDGVFDLASESGTALHGFEKRSRGRKTIPSLFPP